MLLAASEISSERSLYYAGRDRVEILIEWIGRHLRAEANAADLLPLAVRP
jgi:hypothetical protein